MDSCTAKFLRKAAGEEQGRGTASVGAQEFAQAATKIAVPLCLFIVSLQFFQGSHQRLGDVSSPVNTEATRSGHLLQRRLSSRDHRSCHVYQFFPACRTAATKAWTCLGSFFPCLASTPEATSTPQGFRISIASLTLVGLSPPAITTQSRVAMTAILVRRIRQSKVSPVPPSFDEVPESTRKAWTTSGRHNLAHPSGCGCSIEILTTTFRSDRCFTTKSATRGSSLLPCNWTAVRPTSSARAQIEPSN